MSYWVYVLRSATFPRRYVGQTGDLKTRLQRHHAGMVFATAPYRPWRLIHTEEFATRAEAMQRERYLKTGQGRDYLDQIEHQLARQGPPAAD